MEAELAKLSWSEAPKIITEVPGPKSKAILDADLANATITRMVPYEAPNAWSEAFGATAKDPDGNVFIDLCSSVGVNNTGHCHPKVVQVIRRECGILMHNPDTPTINRVLLGNKLAEIAPGSMKNNVKLTYALSGSSAVETALKFAKKVTGRPYIASFEGSYHGCLGLSMEVGTNQVVRGPRGIHRPFSPFVVYLTPYAYCYRCPWNLQHPDCNLECVRMVEFQIANPHGGVDPEEIAAIIVEPMQGEGGYIHPPDGWLRAIKSICEKHGILLIADEVQCGMGRTAKYFTVEHHRVEPDMIVLGKALGGDLPFSAVVEKKAVDEQLAPMSHVLTSAGNSLSCAVALTNIEILGGLLDRSALLGDYMMECFREMAKDREIIGDVRGKGLGIGVELVKNRDTKEPISFDDVARLELAFRDKGTLQLTSGRFGNVLRIAPPLVITKDLVDKALEVTAECLKDLEADIL
jgi:4-aminobutyrate aminotransferase